MIAPVVLILLSICCLFSEILRASIFFWRFLLFYLFRFCWWNDRVNSSPHFFLSASTIVRVSVTLRFELFLEIFANSLVCKTSQFSVTRTQTFLKKATKCFSLAFSCCMDITWRMILQTYSHNELPVHSCNVRQQS